MTTTHTHQAPDDAERFRLDPDGYAFTQELCPECGPYVTFAFAVPEDSLYELNVFDDEGGSDVADDFVVAEKRLDEEQIQTLLKKLTEALIGLRSHKQLIKLAHSHRG